MPLLLNWPLWAAILAWFAAQLLKVLIGLATTKKLDLFLFLATGGMPSSHTSFVVALATAMGHQNGFGSPFFAISAGFALVVMGDATGIRRAAGRQAAVLNMMIERLNNPHISLDKKLRELLGHEPIEVAGGLLLGIAIGTIKYWLV